MLTPNMNLPVPSVGSTDGPQYALDINACLGLLDSHNHTLGAGVAIPTAGLNINADLSIGGYNLDDVLSLRFNSQGAVLAGPSDVSCAYAVNGDLYYNDSNGTPIRITQAGAVVGTPGSITNLLAPASATYVALSETFVWQSAVNEPADMDFRSAILRNNVPSGFGLTLLAPTLTADYQLTLPLLPVSTKIMAMTSAGVMSAPYSVDNSTIEIAANVIQAKDGGITNAKLANMAALTVKANATNSSAAPQDIAAGSDGLVLRRSGTALDFGQVVAAGIASNAVQTAKINDGAVTPAKLSSATFAVCTFTTIASASIPSGSGAATTGQLGSTDLTCTGNRPVLVTLQPSLGSNGSLKVAVGSSGACAIGIWINNVLRATALVMDDTGAAEQATPSVSFMVTPNMGQLVIGTNSFGVSLERLSGTSVNFSLSNMTVTATQL